MSQNIIRTCLRVFMILLGALLSDVISRIHHTNPFVRSRFFLPIFFAFLIWHCQMTSKKIGLFFFQFIEVVEEVYLKVVIKIVFFSCAAHVKYTANCRPDFQSLLLYSSFEVVHQIKKSLSLMRH